MPTPPKTKNPGARKGPKAAASASAAPAEGASLLLKKKDLMDRVTAALGAKKGNVKEIADAVLKVIGDAAVAGEDMALPPLGRIRVVKAKEGGQNAGGAITLKLRRNDGTGAGAKPGGKKAKQPLAEESEES